MGKDYTLIAGLMFGISLCGATGYYLYQLYKKDNLWLSSNSYKIKIPNVSLGQVIGRKGNTLRQIEEKTNTKVHIMEATREDYTFAIIEGTRESIMEASDEISKIVALYCILIKKDVEVSMLTLKKLLEKGELVKNEIAEKSGAKCTITTEKLSSNILLTGYKHQVDLAEMCLKELERFSKANSEDCANRLIKRKPRGTSKVKQSLPIQYVEKLDDIIPGKDGLIEVYVSAVLSPSQFWVQIVGPKANELDQLINDMTEFYSKSTNRFLHMPNTVDVGDIVAVTFRFDKNWYRAEVLKLQLNEGHRHAYIYYLDYGGCDSIPLNEIFELRTDFFSLRYQAIECFLANVKSIDYKWFEDAIDKFEDLVQVAQWKKLRARISGYEPRPYRESNYGRKREAPPTPGICLYDINSEYAIDIANELVKSGYAVPSK